MLSVEAIEDAEVIVRAMLSRTAQLLRLARLDGQARGVDSCVKLPLSAACLGKTLNNVAITVRMAHDQKDRNPEAPEAIAAEATAITSAAVASYNGPEPDLEWLAMLAARLDRICDRPPQM